VGERAQAVSKKQVPVCHHRAGILNSLMFDADAARRGEGCRPLAHSAQARLASDLLQYRVHGGQRGAGRADCAVDDARLWADVFVVFAAVAVFVNGVCMHAVNFWLLLPLAHPVPGWHKGRIHEIRHDDGVKARQVDAPQAAMSCVVPSNEN